MSVDSHSHESGGGTEAERHGVAEQAGPPQLEIDQTESRLEGVEDVQTSGSPQPEIDQAKSLFGGVEDVQIWKDLQEIYGNGFFKLSSARRPGLMGIAERLLGYTGVKKYQRPSSPSETKKHFGFVVNFGDIQRMYMRYLHTKLINIAVLAQPQVRRPSTTGLQTELEALSQLGPVLRNNVRAVKDHEYMAQFARRSNDPFVATSRRYHDRFLLERACSRAGLTVEDFRRAKRPLPTPSWPVRVPSMESHDGRWLRHRPSAHETTEVFGQGSGQEDEQEAENRRNKRLIDILMKKSIPTGPWETFAPGDRHAPASALINTRTTSAKEAFWIRVGAAVIGGAFLITPMWILALQRQLFVHLGVATGFVTAFGLTVSFYLETVEGVFAATLAYAAVIMVFVGVVLEETGGNGA